VVENFDFQKLTRSDEITGDFDVRLGWSRITTRMIVANSDSDTRDPHSNEWKELTITNRAADGRVDVLLLYRAPLPVSFFQIVALTTPNRIACAGLSFGICSRPTMASADYRTMSQVRVPRHSTRSGITAFASGANR
jgi:hypothetical protein